MTREEFLAERRTGIGGSDCDSLFDLLPYGCRRKLWNSKRGVETDFEVDVTSQMERGTMLEPLVADLYARKTGRAVVTIGVVRDPEHPELLVHCDRVISKQPYDREKWLMEMGDVPPWNTLSEQGLRSFTDPGLQRKCFEHGLCGPWGVLEIKTGNREMFHRYKSEGLPPAYILQVQHAMSVTGLSFGAMAFFWPDGWKMLPFDYDRNEGLIETIKASALDFWHLVTDGPAPDPLPPSDERCDGCEYRRSCHGETWAAIERTTAGGFDESLDPLVEAYAMAKPAFDEAESRLEKAKADLKEALGNREKASCRLAKSISFKPNREWDTAAIETDLPGIAAAYRTKWNLGKLSEDHPELEKDYKKPGQTRPLRVTLRDL